MERSSSAKVGIAPHGDDDATHPRTAAAAAAATHPAARVAPSGAAAQRGDEADFLEALRELDLEVPPEHRHELGARALAADDDDTEPGVISVLQAPSCMLHATRCMLHATRCMPHAACCKLPATSPR